MAPGRKIKSGGRLSQELYDELEVAFLEQPGQIAAVSRKVGVTWATADKAWRLGSKHLKLPALSEVIKVHQIKARAQVEAERAATRALKTKEAEDARKNAIEQRKIEGQIVQFSQAQSAKNLTVAINLANGASSLITTLKDWTEIEKEKINRWLAYERAVLIADPTAVRPEFAKPSMSLDGTTILIERIARINSQIVATARQAMEMVRLHLGQPTNIVEMVEYREDVPEDEIDARVESALRALQVAKQVGGLRVLEGGRAQPEHGEVVQRKRAGGTGGSSGQNGNGQAGSNGQGQGGANGSNAVG